MKLKLVTLLSGIALLGLLVSIPSVQAKSLWDVHPGEYSITALYKGFVNGILELKTETGLKKFPTAPDFVMALSGKRTGSLVNSAEYPKDLNVEVFFNSKDQVRALKNIPLPVIEAKSNRLVGLGHDIFYSPDGRHYLLFDYLNGLSLYSPEKILYSSLGTEPAAAWNSTGSKFACAQGQDLTVYDLSRLNNPEIIQLPPLPADVARIIIGLEWSSDNTKLLYYCLEDFPDIDSYVFRVAVTDLLGNELASKVVFNLGYACWADGNSVILVNYSDIECSHGEVSLWHTKTGLMEILIPWTQGICREFAYTKEEQAIAYTIDKGVGQEIHYFNLTNSEASKNSGYSPFPLRNMQWSKDCSLYYWDEYNELIWVFSKPLEKLDAPQPIVTGYISKNSVQNGFLYFLSEPLEEPLQPYLYE